ncbi:MAG: hypothetical protein GEU79_09015 [Acidimicrobiia bacterium]|nr:hypothetical protein [Acidimicrobiia bacterium]
MFRDDRNLERIAFLIERAIADVETAIEAALTGYPGVASDAMRDVMEIELLLLSFFADPDRMDLWLTGDERTRRREFTPAALRKYLKKIGIGDLNSPSAASDYKAHSAALHVNPDPPLHVSLAKGHVESDDLLSLDRGFIEVFEHCRRLGNSIILVADRLSPGSPAADFVKGSLPAFSLAYERTQEMLSRFLDEFSRISVPVVNNEVHQADAREESP